MDRIADDFSAIRAGLDQIESEKAKARGEPEVRCDQRFANQLNIQGEPQDFYQKINTHWGISEFTSSANRYPREYLPSPVPSKCIKATAEMHGYVTLRADQVDFSATYTFETEDGGAALRWTGAKPERQGDYAVFDYANGTNGRIEKFAGEVIWTPSGPYIP